MAETARMVSSGDLGGVLKTSYSLWDAFHVRQLCVERGPVLAVVALGHLAGVAVIGFFSEHS
jgi:hypothetical protein